MPPYWDPDEPMFVGSEGVGAAADKMHWESFVRDVQALAQYATSKGVSIALENSPARHLVVEGKCWSDRRFRSS